MATFSTFYWTMNTLQSPSCKRHEKPQLMFDLFMSRLIVNTKLTMKKQQMKPQPFFIVNYICSVNIRDQLLYHILFCYNFILLIIIQDVAYTPPPPNTTSYNT